MLVVSFYSRECIGCYMSIFISVEKQIEWENHLSNFDIILSESYSDEILTAHLEDKKRIIIDWDDIPFDMRDFLFNLSGEHLKMCLYEMKKALSLDTEHEFNLGFKNFPDTIDLDRCSQDEYSDKIIQVEGMIGSVSAPMSFVSKIIWKCGGCEHLFPREYDFYDKANSTNYCPECRSKQYCSIFKRVKTDFQMVELVRPVSVVGRTPESFRVVLKEDLVEFGDSEERKLISGNKMTVIGIDEDFPAYKKSVRRKPFINAFGWSVDKEYLKLTEEDIAEVKELSKKENIIEKLIDDVAPSIKGLREIKKAILLQSVGGVSGIRGDGTKKRGTIHILLVGDPSTGKTTLGRWTTKYIPKSRYVVASSVSKAGLGASLRRDEKLGYWYVDAGALLLADSSIAVIDEMDKAGGDDLNQLDMVMENESLTITKIKAGEFVARTSILALANPKYSRFDPYMSVGEQIKLQPQTLSRFDLKFALKDTVDEERDRGVVKSKFGKIKTKIPEELIVKYLYYAKQIEPKMGKKCQDKIENFYADLRKKSLEYGEEVVSITTRQSDSIIRLSEAFAKLRLSEEVTEEDVDRAISLIYAYIKTFGYDAKTGQIDIDLADMGKSRSKRDLIIQVLDVIKKNSSRGNPISEEDVIAKCIPLGMEKDFIVNTAIKNLSDVGDIYKPKSHHYEALQY